MKKSILLGIGFLLLNVYYFSSATAGHANASAASGFSAQRTSVGGVPVIRLLDSARGIEVSIVPSFGNKAYEMKIHGNNILYMPDAGPSDFLKRAVQNGIPFMAPWANRLDDTGFWANGKKYNFDLALDNFRKDAQGLPIHGLITNSKLWQITDVGADQKSAYATSKFEFWKYPDLMAQWPFAHEYEMTYRLSGGSLEVRTTVSNLSAESMPLAIGFHPYYRIPGIPRDQWILHIPARKRVVADARLIPSGEFKELDLPNPLPLKGQTLDDGFTDMARDANGRARFSIEADGKQIELFFGTKYPVAVIWNPSLPGAQSMEFICIEPMTGVTNAINLNHAGKYSELQTVPANSKWTESFWIQPNGF
jgi:aldose 1-epimerase